MDHASPIGRLYIFCLCIALGISPYAVAVEKQVTLNMRSSVQSDYIYDLLKLALSYSEHTYTFSSTNEIYSRPRMMESIKNGHVSLMWGGTSEEMESEFIPVRIDVYRGLMNHRLFFIRAGDQARFDKINTLDDLRQIKFGQGRSWQDAKILESAGLTVIKTTKKPGLFYMLDGERFDAFPRGASEAWTELKAFPDLKLTVEKNLVLIYPLPTYFFVSKHDPELAQELEKGLEAAIADGSFDAFFYSAPEVKEALAKSEFNKRRALHIENPFLPKATPLDRKDLFIDLTGATGTTEGESEEKAED